jgi:hypothetical protein
MKISFTLLLMVLFSQAALAAADLDSQILSAVQKQTQSEIKSGEHHQRLLQASGRAQANTPSNGSAASAASGANAASSSIAGISSPSQSKGGIAVLQQQKKAFVEVSQVKAKPIFPLKPPVTTKPPVTASH